MKIKNLEKIQKQLSTVMDNSKGLKPSGFEIEETDLDLSMKDDYLWDELPAFNFEDPPVDPVKFSMAMVTLMREKGGMALAANQVGHNFAMFVTEGEPAFAVFNPTITFRSPNEVLMDEACLSFPGLNLKIKRPASIRVRFQEPYGNWITRQFAGMSARVFLQMADHLIGVDFTDKVSKLKLDMAKKKVKSNG
jgi:peptide deformylase|tara:strand:+ start:287 stop:865 length:579 start_codon:yes stop_codon:yes gene_type:complete